METVDLSRIREILSERFADERVNRLKDLPPPSSMLNLQRAATRISQAIQNREKIVIVGDYDVDGVVATALLIRFFDSIDCPVKWEIPNRFTDGYGFSSSLAERLEGDLVVTVDNGITAHEAASICQQRGIDLIITDHHEPIQGVPDAFCVVDPKQPGCEFPFSEICGAQVAWYLIAAMKQQMGLKIDLKAYLDWVALAVIADAMPLKEVNRVMLKTGLQELARSVQPSSMLIRELLREDINAENLAYSVAPLLNAAGRMADASLALKFLMAKNVMEAETYLKGLQGLNQERKLTEARICKEALSHGRGNDKVIIAWGEEWHEGVLGIVASRLTEQLKLTSIVLTKKDNILKGSARAYGKTDILGALKHCDSHLLQYGGHKGAAGLSLDIESLDAFQQMIEEYFFQEMGEECDGSMEDVIGVIDSEMIGLELVRLLEDFEPYGKSNPRPRFFLKNPIVLEVKKIGEQKNHTSFWIAKNSHEKIKAVAFYQTFDKNVQALSNCLVSVVKNIYNQKVSPQLVIHGVEKYKF